ncbi:MAG: restriction endonuclease, partial [Alloprevotella sp.]|nr:restriction endonuclease [Alloprevotella sp.]
TLQKAISANQLKEMHDCRLHLVVPKENISSFPKLYQSELLNLNNFIGMVKEKQQEE